MHDDQRVTSLSGHTPNEFMACSGCGIIFNPNTNHMPGCRHDVPKIQATREQLRLTGARIPRAEDVHIQLALANGERTDAYGYCEYRCPASRPHPKTCPFHPANFAEQGGGMVLSTGSPTNWFEVDINEVCQTQSSCSTTIRDRRTLENLLLSNIKIKTGIL